MNKEEFKKQICSIIDTMSEQECQELSSQLVDLSKEQDIASELIKINGEFKKLTKLIQVIVQNENQDKNEIQNLKPYTQLYKFINDSQDILLGMDHPTFFNLFKFNVQFGSFKMAYQDINKIFEDILETVDLKPLAKVRQQFNSELHEIVEIVNNDKYDDEIILIVTEQGFSYKDKVINYAKVIVNKKEK